MEKNKEHTTYTMRVPKEAYEKGYKSFEMTGTDTTPLQDKYCITLSNFNGKIIKYDK